MLSQCVLILSVSIFDVHFDLSDLIIVIQCLSLK